ncbi:hypothetical protein [Priestia megaterium]|uniref:hypothetical protein n=1 Tax=Priestia megaterium TaxID=1404 RepID=UPI001DA7734C|nr:hypothetical protein [Priestia megaterium]CAH0305413.1 hypothetical protein SRABI82_04709 [Priestia megaterium]
MRNATLNVYKVIIVLLVISYILLSSPSVSTNKISAGMTLFFSLLLLYRSRKNLPLLIVSIFIFYCNYSVIIGEYFVGGELGTPMTQTKTVGIYGLTINILLLFMVVLSLFIRSGKLEYSKIVIKPKNNSVIFYTLICGLMYIFIFGVNRTHFSSYEVSITPMYEYSSLLFLLSYYVSGGLKVRKWIITLMCVAFILQDFYFGGRITSMQLIIFLSLTMILKKLSFRRVILGAFVGILLNTVVHVYRQSYSFSNVNLISILEDLYNSYFVFNTPVFAYYSSSTHVATSEVVGWHEKGISIIEFIGSIFIGSARNLGDVTDYSNRFFSNIGGGFIVTHFYFWLSWVGVVVAATLIIFIVNRIGSGKNDYWKLATICFIFSVPRWYLYTPLSMFRPLFLLFVLYIITQVVHHVLLKIAGVRKPQINVSVTSK